MAFLTEKRFSLFWARNARSTDNCFSAQTSQGIHDWSRTKHAGFAVKTFVRGCLMAVVPESSRWNLSPQLRKYYRQNVAKAKQKRKRCVIPFSDSGLADQSNRLFARIESSKRDSVFFSHTISSTCSTRLPHHYFRTLDQELDQNQVRQKDPRSSNSLHITRSLAFSHWKWTMSSNNINSFLFAHSSRSLKIAGWMEEENRMVIVQTGGNPW